MFIREVMSQPALTCRPIDTLEAAARLMWEHDLGALPVVDERGRVVGMITDRDICMSAYTRGRALSQVAVSEAMAREVFSCRSNDSLEAVEGLMSERQIRRVPVVDGENRPIGLVSLGDIARHAHGAPERDGLDDYALRTLAAICRPRPRLEAPAPGAPLEERQRPVTAI